MRTCDRSRPTVVRAVGERIYSKLLLQIRSSLQGSSRPATCFSTSGRVWPWTNRRTYIRHHYSLGFGRSFSKSHFRRTAATIVPASCKPLSLEPSSARRLTRRNVSHHGRPWLMTILSSSFRLADPNGFQTDSSSDKRAGKSRREMVSISSVSVHFICYIEYQAGRLESVNLQRVERKQRAVLIEFELERLVVNCQRR